MYRNKLSKVAWAEWWKLRKIGFYFPSFCLFIFFYTFPSVANRRKKGNSNAMGTYRKNKDSVNEKKLMKGREWMLSAQMWERQTEF